MSKIIVVGDVNGQFPTVLEKIAGLHAKNSFALALFVGNLFADPLIATDEDKRNVRFLVDGSIDVPLPAYFALGNRALPEEVTEKLEANGGELCPNLYFLGKRTTIKIAEGIRIVALGGSLDPNVTVGTSKDKYLPFYSEDDARSLRGANTADILVSSEWPANIKSGSQIDSKPNGEEPILQQCISDLCSVLKPRYHFSTSGDAFYEREPFYHAPSDPSADTFAITRFISLASFGNAQKQKWIYAFSLDPHAAPPISIPPGTTSSPLSTTGKKRPAPTQESSYRFSTDHDNRRKHNKRSRAPPPTPAECFFCLSNPNLATHLVTSIGDDAYLTTAKGPLTTTSTFEPVGISFPCHILIIPLTHSPTLGMVEGDDSRHSTYAEMSRYRNALNKMLMKKAGAKLGSVTWEVSRATGIHIHWQFLPIPAELIKGGLVEAAFKVEAENEKYPAFRKKDIGDGRQEDDFFRVIIWQAPEDDADTSLGTEQSLVLPLDTSFRFDLQFGRRVLAKLLGLEKRINWKDCGQSQAEETTDAEAFKDAFKEFDFSLDN